MQIHHYHPVTGLYLGDSQADESPLEPGIYLIPAHATDTPPPPCEAGERAVWAGDAWRVEAIPLDPVPPAQTLEDVQAAAVMRIKSVAGEIILGRLPAWKQANLTARAVELLSAGETSSQEWLDIQAEWAWVKAIRSSSDQSEATVVAASNQPEVAIALETALVGLEAIQ